MGAQIKLTAGQALQFCRSLQAPILATGLDTPLCQTAAPVTLGQLTVQCQIQLELRPVEREGDCLLADIPFAVDVQIAQGRFVQADIASFQGNQGALRAV